MRKTSLEFIIKTQQDLIHKLFSLNDWTLMANKKVMSTETDNWYLKWKVDYLEKRIKEHFPKADLYHEDDADFEKLKQDGIQQNSNKHQIPEDQE